MPQNWPCTPCAVLSQLSPLRIVPLVNPAFQNACLRYLRIPRRTNPPRVGIIHQNVLNILLKAMQISKRSFLMMLWLSLACSSHWFQDQLAWLSHLRSSKSCLVAPAPVYRKRYKFIITLAPTKNLIIGLQQTFYLLKCSALSIDGKWRRPWRPPSAIYIAAHVSVWCSLLC